MIERNCEKCGRIFRTWPCRVKRGAGRFCSVACIGVNGRMVATKHGHSKTRLYRIWGSMKISLLGHTPDLHGVYFKKGIKVCEEWQSFEPFREWAIKNGYRDDLEIDRIDPTGNYEPTNCRFVTNAQQARNRTKMRTRNSSKFKGVSRSPDAASGPRWSASIRVDNKHLWLGTFLSEEEAAHAYDSAARQHFGEFAYLNFRGTRHQ